MSIQLQFRRGNTAQTAVFTGAVAELTVDTDKNTVILHDGVTAGGYALARESALSANQALAQNAFNKANAAYDAANTKYNSSGGTISGNVIVTGNVTPTTDNVYSLGSAGARWKDIFVGAGTVDIDGVKLSKVNNQLVITGATDLVLSGTNLPSSSNTANNIANAFNQANLAYDAANTAFTAGGARAFDQANLAFDKANSAWDYANSAYGTANNEILTRQANVGAAVITLTGNYEANTGAALIAAKSYTDTANNYLQANVGQLRLDTSNANNSLAANIGAARIADVAAGQANVGAGLITVTSAYQANVGAARIIALGRADSAFAQANLAYDAANNVAPQIQPTRDVANSAFAQANLAYAAANSKLSSSGGTISGDLAVTGNLTISGNTTTLNVSSLKVTDSIIQLATDNQTDLVDIGFVGHYANTPNNHTGLVRRYTDGRYYLFDSYTPGTEPTNLIDVANTRVATLSANLVTNVITLRGLDPLNYANTIQTSAQANVGAGLISVTNAYQANVGALRIDTNTANSSLAANIGAARIAITSEYQANVGAGLIANKLDSDANVGAGLISVTSAYQANVGAGLLTKVAKSGDTISGVLTITGGDGTYSSLELNGYNQRGGSGYHGFLKANNTSAASGAKHFRINSAGSLEIVNSGYTATIFAVSDTGDLSSVKSIRLYESFVGSGSLITSSTSQVTLDSFSTTSYRSGKYLVQMSSGSAYHMIELSLIHDGTTVYLSQYGEVKSGASLGTFDATISAGTLSLLFTPTNSVTTAKYFTTLLPT